MGKEFVRPLISIITVVFNSAVTLEDTILSVTGQSFKDYEYIIVDGGSTDGSVEIIERYSNRITKWLSESDEGIYDAMNKGLHLVRGRFIYFLGADDIFLSNESLKEIAPFLLKDYSIYYGNVLFKHRNVVYDGRFNALKLVTRNISHQSIFYSQHVFEEFKFNTRYRIFADYELNLKLYNHSLFAFRYFPITIAIFDDKGASGSNTEDANFERDRLHIIKQNFNYIIYFYRLIRTKLADLIHG